MTRIAPALHIANPAVAAVFEAYPVRVRTSLLVLRELILTTAEQTPGVGAITETLKWGQPAYLPVKPRIGTTVRIDRVKSEDAAYAIYFHCQTTLIDDFRGMFGSTFTFEGNRAILLSAGQRHDEAALRTCVAMALSYHVHNRRP